MDLPSQSLICGYPLAGLCSFYSEKSSFDFPGPVDLDMLGCRDSLTSELIS